MKPQTASEQPVAVRVVHNIFRCDTGGGVHACHGLRPHLDILRRVRSHRRLTGRPARRVHAHDFFAQDGQHPKWIIVAQILFGRKREFIDILQRFDVRRLDAARVEGIRVKWHLAIDTFGNILQALELQFLLLAARHRFGFFVPNQNCGTGFFHRTPPVGTESIDSLIYFLECIRYGRVDNSSKYITLIASDASSPGIMEPRCAGNPPGDDASSSPDMTLARPDPPAILLPYLQARCDHFPKHTHDLRPATRHAHFARLRESSVPAYANPRSCEINRARATAPGQAMAHRAAGGADVPASRGRWQAFAARRRSTSLRFADDARKVAGTIRKRDPGLDESQLYRRSEIADRRPRADCPAQSSKKTIDAVLARGSHPIR